MSVEDVAIVVVVVAACGGGRAVADVVEHTSRAMPAVIPAPQMMRAC